LLVIRGVMKKLFFQKDSPASSTPDAALSAGVSRRAFLKGLGTTAVSAAALGAGNVAKGLAQANAEQVRGPGPVSCTLRVNGESRTFQLEPRTTLLEALRVHAGLTGPKEACDRAACGACTVLLGDLPVNACSLLAIEAQGAEITTIEGLSRSGELTKLQQAFVDKDGLQCGFCTPGMVMTLTALLRRNPHPTEAEVRDALAGNLCRCGSQPRVVAAALAAGGASPAAKLEILHPQHHGLA
jgi:aerobic-type carbon monoxide dehydrogenase small subunit (CoxS/CutS family)